MVSEKLLYHYCSTQTAVSILRNKTIWLSGLSNANDASEGRLLGNFLAEHLKGIVIPCGMAEFIAAILCGFVETVDGFAFCLSEDRDSLSQWIRYGDNCFGIAIGFAPDAFCFEPSEQCDGIQDRLVKVNYFDIELLEDKYRDFILGIRDFYLRHGEFVRLRDGVSREKYIKASTSRPISSFGLEEIDLLKHQKSLLDLLAHLGSVRSDMYALKPTYFHDEKEWRLLTHRYRGLNSDVDFICTGRIVRPYVARELKSHNIKNIKEIVLGIKNTSSPDWIKAFLEKTGLSHVRVVRSSNESFR